MSDKGRKSRALGRGLSALMADMTPPPAAPQGQGAAATDQVRRVPVEQVVPNPAQPRRAFGEDALEDLARSIAEKGVLQPLIVRPHPATPGSYEIIAGERRWRAAQRAQVHELPVIVRDYTDQEVLEAAIVENIQRADLNPIEEAAGYRQLIDRFGHTQEQIATALGKSRSHVANLLRLLTLPSGVLSLVQAGSLTAGHARALITLPDPEKLARRAVEEGLTVRDLERLSKDSPDRPAKPAKSGGRPAADADTRALEADLSASLGLSVGISHKTDGTGQVVIRYQTLEDLDRICALIGAASEG